MGLALIQETRFNTNRLQNFLPSSELGVFSTCHQMKKTTQFFHPHPRTFFFIAFRERGREREKHQCETETLTICLLYALRLGILHAQARDGTHNVGMCPDREWNPQPFGERDDTPTNCATWPGSFSMVFFKWVHLNVGGCWRQNFQIDPKIFQPPVYSLSSSYSVQL